MTRERKERIKLFVEGDTEKNYFEKLRKNNNVEITYTEVNMGGGGYTSFLKKVKKSSDLGYIAVFIVIDLDKYIDEPHSHKQAFEALVSFCRSRNKISKKPYFLIVSNRDFEYFACCHCGNYKSGDTKAYIAKVFNYQNVDEFKADKKIYEFLNSNSRSFDNAVTKIRGRKPFISNRFKKIYKNLDITINIEEIIISDDACNYYHSNLYELFDIIGVKG